MILVPFNSAHAFIALGSWLVEGIKYVCRQGLLRMDLLLTAVGVEKRGRIFSWSSFYSGRQGAADIRWDRITSSLTNFLISYAKRHNVSWERKLPLSAWTGMLTLVRTSGCRERTKEAWLWQMLILYTTLNMSPSGHFLYYFAKGYNPYSLKK